MNVFETVKYGVNCREAAERYGMEVSRHGILEKDQVLTADAPQAPDFLCLQFHKLHAPFFHVQAFFITHAYYIIDNGKSPALAGFFRQSEFFIEYQYDIAKKQLLSKDFAALQKCK